MEDSKWADISSFFCTSSPVLGLILATIIMLQVNWIFGYFSRKGKQSSVSEQPDTGAPIPSMEDLDEPKSIEEFEKRYPGCLEEIEQEVVQAQLNAIFKKLQKNETVFGDDTPADVVRENMKLYGYGL